VKKYICTNIYIEQTTIYIYIDPYTLIYLEFIQLKNDTYRYIYIHVHRSYIDIYIYMYIDI